MGDYDTVARREGAMTPAAPWAQHGLALEVAALDDAALSEQLRLLADVPAPLAWLAAGRRALLMLEASRRLRGAA
jgi:hypothetical protein